MNFNQDKNLVNEINDLLFDNKYERYETPKTLMKLDPSIEINQESISTVVQDIFNNEYQQQKRDLKLVNPKELENKEKSYLQGVINDVYNYEYKTEPEPSDCEIKMTSYNILELVLIRTNEKLFKLEKLLTRSRLENTYLTNEILKIVKENKDSINEELITKINQTIDEKTKAFQTMLETALNEKKNKS